MISYTTIRAFLALWTLLFLSCGETWPCKLSVILLETPCAVVLSAHVNFFQCRICIRECPRKTVAPFCRCVCWHMTIFHVHSCELCYVQCNDTFHSTPVISVSHLPWTLSLCAVIRCSNNQDAIKVFNSLTSFWFFSELKKLNAAKSSKNKKYCWGLFRFWL